MALRTDLSGTKKITVLGLLLAAGIVLNLAENMIPVFTVLPGGKLGLANVVTMLVMLWFGPLTALVLGVLRSLLTGILSGMATMAGLRRRGNDSERGGHVAVLPIVPGES